ncbi:hypothetical protein ACHAP1_004237 [Verticillium nonalfalfae]
MTELPLTENGKVDRKALRKVGSSFSRSQLALLDHAAGLQRRHPTTEAELGLAQLFARVLNIDTTSIGIDDSFLRIGGDSITAMQISAEARARGLNISTAAILRHKTITAILDSTRDSEPFIFVEEARHRETPANPDRQNVGSKHCDFDAFQAQILPQINTTLRPEDVEDIFPCSPMQEAMLISQAKDSKMYRTRLDLELLLPTDCNSLDEAQLQWAWKEVVKRHALLRAILVNHIPGSSGMMHVILKNPEVGMSIRRNSSRTTLYEALEDDVVSYRHCGLQHHVTLYQLDSGNPHLLLDLNHVIADGHSTSIMIRELQDYYNHGKTQSSPQSYHEYISFLKSRGLDEGLEYWTKFLAGVEQCYFPELVSEDMRHCPSREMITVADIDTDRMRAFCASWELTPAIIIQVAWATVLKSYTGMQRPSFGVICSGRDHPINHVDGIFGPLIGMVTASISLENDHDVQEVLTTAQSNYLTALSHQTVPLAAVHSALGLGSSALFNSILSFQKNENYVAEVDEAGLKMKIVDGFDPNDVSPLPSD